MKLFKIAKNTLLPLNAGLSVLFFASMFGPGDVNTVFVKIFLLCAVIFWFFVFLLFRNYKKRLASFEQGSAENPSSTPLFLLLLLPFMLPFFFLFYSIFAIVKEQTYIKNHCSLVENLSSGKKCYNCEDDNRSFCFFR